MKYLIVISLFSLISQPAYSTDSDPKQKVDQKAAPSKEIQFDDSVVEGMNQANKDSLETVSKKDNTHRAHLYVKRNNFKFEIQQVSKEIGELP